MNATKPTKQLQELRFQENNHVIQYKIIKPDINENLLARCFSLFSQN